MSYREKKAKVRPLSEWLAEAEALLNAKVRSEKDSVVVEQVATKAKPKKKARLPTEKLSLG